MRSLVISAWILIGTATSVCSHGAAPANDAWVVQECVLRKLPKQLGYKHDVDMLPDLKAVRTADIARLIGALDSEVRSALRDASRATWKEKASVDDSEFQDFVGSFMEALGRSLDARFNLQKCGSEYFVVGAAATIASQWFYSVIPQSESLSWNERTDLSFAVVMAAGALQAGHEDAFEQLTKRHR